MTTDSHRNGPLLELTGVTKKFLGRPALHSVDFDIRHGEIHGLVGQNGSGKSTLVKILAGFHAPEPGARMFFGGEEVRLPLDTEQPARLGLSFVHQDLGLVNNATVLENFKIGRYRCGSLWRVSWAKESRETLEALRRFGLDLDPYAPVSELDVVDKTILAIARCMDAAVERNRARRGHADEADGLLVLDEPSSYLPPDGVRRLFDTMRQAAAFGFGVVFVSHRLAEILEVTDRVTVLRDGRKVMTVDSRSLEEDLLIEAILGFSLGDLYPYTPPAESARLSFSIRGAAGAGLHGVDFDIHPGEILGLTGLLGSGFETLPYLLFGAQPCSTGVLRDPDAEHPLPEMTPKKAMSLGLALLPADRVHQSANPVATMLENISLPSLRSFKRRGRLDLRQEHQVVTKVMADVDVRPLNPNAHLSSFSGGNQQKGLIAKWLLTRPRCFLMHEPTQGVDIGAKQQIFRLITELSDDGNAIVVASSEYEDLAHLCHRVFIFREGAIAGELSGHNLTADRILEQCMVSSGDRTQSTPIGQSWH